LPKYITAFNQKYPKVRLQLMDANSTTLQNELSLGQLDLVIDNHTLPEDLFDQTQLATEYLLLAVPAHFPENELLAPYRLTYGDILAGKHESATGNVPIQKLQNVPFILMNRDNDTRKVTDHIFRKLLSPLPFFLSSTV
jgi:DNA-binding transcriptional LysR family regulator